MSYVLNAKVMIDIIQKNLAINTVSGHSKRRAKLAIKTDYRSMLVKSIAECILQYFRPSLSYNLSLRALFSLFLSGC